MNNKTYKFLCVHQGHELYGSDRVFIQSVKAIREEWPDSYITVHLSQEGLIVDKISSYASQIIFGNLSILRKGNITLNFVIRLIKNIYINHKRSRQYDFVYINTGVIACYNFISLFIKNKFILHLHEIPIGTVKLYFTFICKYTKALIITNSRATNSYSNGIIIYNGIPPVNYLKERTPSSSSLKLLLIGRLNSWKGHKIALQAIRVLKDRNISDIKLNMVGSYYSNNSHYLDDIKKMIIELNLENQIEIHNFIIDPSEYYKNADCVLVPSIHPEPFGLVATEAMNWSLPVIASNHGGLTEIVDHNKTGILVKPSDAESLAHAIQSYFYDRETMHIHGKAGRERFMNLFQEKHYLSKFTEIVKNHVK